jgi:hypothetical protein
MPICYADANTITELLVFACTNSWVIYGIMVFVGDITV